MKYFRTTSTGRESVKTGLSQSIQGTPKSTEKQQSDGKWHYSVIWDFFNFMQSMMQIHLGTGTTPERGRANGVQFFCLLHKIFAEWTHPQR